MNLSNFVDDAESLELTYLVKIENWPWNNDSNIIRFCFNIHSTHSIYDDDVYVRSPNEVITDIINENTLHICHIVYSHYLKVTHSGYIFHESRMNDDDILLNSTDDEYSLLISTINGNVINANIDDDLSNHDKLNLI